MIKEHERIVLTVAVPDEGLEPGDVGTVERATRRVPLGRIQVNRFPNTENWSAVL